MASDVSCRGHDYWLGAPPSHTRARPSVTALGRGRCYRRRRRRVPFPAYSSTGCGSLKLAILVALLALRVRERLCRLCLMRGCSTRRACSVSTPSWPRVRVRGIRDIAAVCASVWFLRRSVCKYANSRVNFCYPCKCAFGGKVRKRATVPPKFHLHEIRTVLPPILEPVYSLRCGNQSLLSCEREFVVIQARIARCGG